MADDSNVDPFGGLAGEDRDAYAVITNTLKAYGLESLAPTVLGYIKGGYSQDTIATLLPTTPAYQKRFAGNAARIKAGLPALSPAEYLSVEGSYRQIMSAAGLPPGFYDSPDDFTKWISDDVAPTEIQERVTVATDMVNSLDPSSKAAFEQFYSAGDMVAYALDRERATTVLDRQWRAAQVAGAAQDNALTISQQQAERVAGVGLSANQARAGVAQAATLAKGNERLSSIYGGDYTDDDAVDEVFLDSAVSKQKRKGLASQERGQFGGSSATGAGALTNRRAGQV